jgi:hypothetical protein
MHSRCSHTISIEQISPQTESSSILLSRLIENRSQKGDCSPNCDLDRCFYSVRDGRIDILSCQCPYGEAQGISDVTIKALEIWLLLPPSSNGIDRQVVTSSEFRCRTAPNIGMD